MNIQLQISGVARHIIFLFLHRNICCGYSLEAPHLGTSNKCLQFMFSWRNRKNINTFWRAKMPYLELYGKCPKISNTKVSDKVIYANSADPDQTAPVGAV